MAWLRGRARPVTIALSLAALLLALSALGSTTAHASGCENSWTNSKGGSWFNSENWSRKAVPAASEEVCIIEPGTYAVEMDQTANVSVKALTVGAASGTQTLTVASTCSVNAVLSTTGGIAIGTNGALTMTNGDSCPNSVTLSGPVSNAGVLTTLPAHGGSRSLQGSLTNTGTLAIEATTAFNGSKAALTNEGAIKLAEGTQLQVNGENSVSNGSGGKIVATGSGAIVTTGAASSFNEGAGTTSGTRPVIVEDGTLTYTGAGEGPIMARGAARLAGASSAGQSLTLESTCGKNVTATAPAGFANGGTMTFTNADGCANNVTLSVPAGDALTNSGTIVSAAAIGGERNLQGSTVNDGTIDVDRTTRFNGAKATLTNEGAIALAEGVQLQVSNAGSVANAAGGSISATGSGAVVLSGGTFTEGAGTTAGSKPVIVEDGALDYSGAGASTIALHGSSSLAGTLSSGQSLSVESTCAKNAAVSVGSNVGNGGSIALTNGDGCANNVTVNVAAGDALTNSGTLSSEHEKGGSRSLTGVLVNTGSFDVDTATTMTGAGTQLENKGALNVANGTSLSLSSGAVASNEAGTITGTGSGALVQSGATFTEGAGKTSGSKPVILEDLALVYAGSGEGPIALRGSSSLSGSLSAGQSLSIESTCAKNAAVSVAASLTNGGSIALRNADGCANNTALNIEAGATLTNDGSLATEHTAGGSRTITGNVSNGGTLTIATNTSYGGSGATLLNRATISLAEGVTLSVTGPANVANEAGTITGPGSLVQSGGTFTENAGKTSGALPVVLEDGTLKYAGAGASTIAVRGTSSLTGTLVKEVETLPSKGQTLLLQSTCGKNATISAPAFTNAGTIVLENGDGCSNGVTLSLGGGTLTNKAAIDVEHGAGGTRRIEAPVVNEKTVTVAAGQTLNVAGSYTQQGKKGVFATGIASPSSFGVLSASGPATIAGTLSVVQAKGLSVAEGDRFAVLGSSALSGTFAKLKGNKIKKSKPAIKFNARYSGTGVTLEVGP